jgi:hypothetical protein
MGELMNERSEVWRENHSIGPLARESGNKCHIDRFYGN